MRITRKSQESLRLLRRQAAREGEPDAGMRTRWPLALLLVANAASITGNMFTTLAMPWFVLATTGSVSRTGVVAIASTLPIVVSAGTAAALVDLLGLRRSSVLSDLASGVIVVAIPALYLTAGLPFGVLLVLLFVRWFLAAPGDTARAAMIPDLASRGGVAMHRATAAYDGINRGGRMAGASLAGVLILWLGPISLLFVDGGTFLLSAILIGLGIPRIGHDQPTASGYLTRLHEGMAFLLRDRILRRVVVIMLVANMLDTGLLQVLLPTYAKQVARDPRVFGLLVGAVGAGALAGTFAYGALGSRLPPRITFAVAVLIGTVPRPLILAAGAPFGIALAVMAVAGFAAGAINPLIGVIEFQRIPGHLRARVLGAITASAYAGMPLGGLLASSLTDATSLRTALFAFGFIYLLLVCIPSFAGRSWREINPAVSQPTTPAEGAPQS
jgi:MFS family permease